MRKTMNLFLFSLIMLLGAGIGLLSADAPTEGRTGRAEVRFLEGMIDHHQMAIDMANDCLTNTSTDEVREICQNVITAQSAEIATMQDWLLNWYGITYAPMPMMQTADPMTGMEGMDHNATITDPPMMMGMMAGLNRLSGIDYEIAWLESMVDHHDDALHMANRILEWAQHDDLIALANRIITDQTAEIEQMETLLRELEA
jgi:uncharacterized protein (DUF305 family)